MDWVRLNDVWMADSENLSFTVRWSRGAWHWRAVYCEGTMETAQFAADNRQEYPNGFVDAESARQSAERWLQQTLREPNN
jgi:hypothetical protein